VRLAPNEGVAARLELDEKLKEDDTHPVEVPLRQRLGDGVIEVDRLIVVVEVLATEVVTEEEEVELRVNETDPDLDTEPEKEIIAVGDTSEESDAPVADLIKEEEVVTVKDTVEDVDMVVDRLTVPLTEAERESRAAVELNEELCEGLKLPIKLDVEENEPERLPVEVRETDTEPVTV